MTSLETTVASQADYETSKTQSIVAQRSHVKISPRYGGEFKAGDIVRLEIPSQNYLDSEYTSVSFQAKIFSTPGTQIPVYWDDVLDKPAANRFCQFQNNIQKLFNRVKLLQGSNVIEDIQDYGTLQHLITIATTPKQWVDTSGIIYEGCYDPMNYQHKKLVRGYGSAVSTADGSITQEEEAGHEYLVQLNLGVLQRAGKYIPLKYTGQLTIELYMEKNAEALYCSSGIDNAGDVIADSSTATYPNAFYVVSQVYLHCFFVVPMEGYDKAVQEKITDGNGIDIHFDTYSTHSRTTGTTSANTITFQERAVSVRGGLCVMRNVANENDIRLQTVFSDNQITEFQWKIGQHYIPSQPVKCNAGGPEAFLELQEAFGSWADTSASGLLTPINFLPKQKNNAADADVSDVSIDELHYEHNKSNGFIMGLNLEKSNGQVSGFNTSATNTDIELNLKSRGVLDAVKYRSGLPKFVGTNNEAGQITWDTLKSTAGWESKPLGYMKVKPLGDNAAVRFIFYAHVDVVLKLSGLGSIQVMR